MVEIQAFPLGFQLECLFAGANCYFQGVVTENYILWASSNSYFDCLAPFDVLDKFTILPSNETSTTWTTSKMVAWYHHLDIIHVRSTSFLQGMKMGEKNRCFMRMGSKKCQLTGSHDPLEFTFKETTAPWNSGNPMFEVSYHRKNACLATALCMVVWHLQSICTCYHQDGKATCLSISRHQFKS